MLREYKPPPIRRIRISDFGLPDPKRDPDRHQNCITWSLSHALPLQNISSKSVHKFASNPTDIQTNRPHRKHNLLLSAEVKSEILRLNELHNRAIIGMMHTAVPVGLLRRGMASEATAPVAGADTRRHLRSTNRQLLAVPRYRLNTYGRRAFSVS